MFDATTVFDSMIMREWNTQPSNVRGVCTRDTAYYTRILYRLIYGRYDFDLPKASPGQIAWKYNWWRFLIFGLGSSGIFYTKAYGWIPLPYSILKFDVQYNPLIIQGTSQYMLTKPARGVVGVNAAIVQIYDDFYGMYDLVTHYATKLAQIDKGIDVNLMNTSLGLYMEVESPKDVQDAKAAYSKATTGEPFVVAVSKSKTPQSQKREYKTMIAEPKNAYLTDKFLEARRTIVNQFLSDIGVNNANTDKKERLITDEANANNEEISIARDYIYDNLKRGIDEMNQITGLNVTVRPHVSQSPTSAFETAPEGGKNG